MQVGTIQQLWRFPVKSMQGDRVEALSCSAACPDDDRIWAVVAADGSRVLSAKRHSSLLDASAAFDGDPADGRVVVTLPDGSAHEAGDPATDAALCEWLGLDVRLARRPPSDAEALHYDMFSDLTDDSSDPFTWAGPPGTWVDLAAAHLLSTASLRAAEELAPDSTWDVRRFRPTALLDLDEALQGFVEDAWVGGTITLGEVAMHAFMPTIRCSMTTRAQPGGPDGEALERDPVIGRTLREHHGQNLGLYCAVTEPGTLRVGDTVSVALA